MNNELLQDNAMAKEHFAVTESSLFEVMNHVYFPVIDIQEHDDMYSFGDLAIKQQHTKLHDTLIIELTALCQILHGQNDNN